MSAGRHDIVSWVDVGELPVRRVRARPVELKSTKVNRQVPVDERTLSAAVSVVISECGDGDVSGRARTASANGRREV